MPSGRRNSNQPREPKLKTRRRTQGTAAGRAGSGAGRPADCGRRHGNLRRRGRERDRSCRRVKRARGWRNARWGNGDAQADRRSALGGAAKSQVGRLGSARLGSARLGSARLGSARLGSARLGSARLGSARLGSARLGSARLGRIVPPAPCTECQAKSAVYGSPVAPGGHRSISVSSHDGYLPILGMLPKIRFDDATATLRPQRSRAKPWRSLGEG